MFAVQLSTLTCIDEMGEDGRGRYSGKTLDELRAEYPGAELMTGEDFTARKEAALATAPKEITEDRWHEMLEVLPPARWHNGRDWNYFHLSEALSGRMVQWFIRHAGRYWECVQRADISGDELRRLVLAEKSMPMLHKDLTVCRLTPEQHRNTCGYWYTVQSEGMPDCAFAKREHLDLWASERGLTIPDPLDAPGWCRIIGSYRTQSHLYDADQFESLRGIRSRTLSNGDYVVAIITDDADGLRTVHTLNPNVKDRTVFDYEESRAMVG